MSANETTLYPSHNFKRKPLSAKVRLSTRCNNKTTNNTGPENDWCKTIQIRKPTV